MGKRGNYYEDGSLRSIDHSASWIRLKILEKYTLGVKDVGLVVRPYKTRTAFANLSSPPTIYLNEYLIDDEEILEYLILRELIHIKLNMFRSSYRGNLSYAAKFDNILHFYTKGEKRLERWKKADRGEPEASMTSFFSSAFLPCPAESSSGGRRRSLARRKEVYSSAGTDIQA